MNDTIKEILIKRQTPVYMAALKFVLIGLCAAGIIGGLVFPIFLLIGLVLAVVCYFVIPKFDVEYEYLYVNGSMDVDVIYSKQKRKKAGEFNLEDLEIAAPEQSHALDSYKNNAAVRKENYTSGKPDARRYVLVYSKDSVKTMVTLELDEEIMEDLRRHAPRKVNQY